MDPETRNLTSFLDAQRDGLRHKVRGLDAEQLARTLPPSDLTLGGLVNHLAFVEDWWLGHRLRDEQDPHWAAVDWRADPDWDWHSAASETPDQVWARWEAAVARSDAAIAEDPRPDLLARRSREPLELRWVLAHLVQEYARHLGHADLIRQSVDGQVGEA